MKDRDFENLLVAAFQKEHKTPENLKRRTAREWEKRGQSEQWKTSTTRRNYRRLVIIAALILVLPMGIYAGAKLLSSQEAALLMDRQELAEAFGTTKEEIMTQQNDNYVVSLLGQVDGNRLDWQEADSKEQVTQGLLPTQTYTVAAVQRADGKQIESYGEAEFFATPLIEGLDPMKWNIAAWNGNWQRVLHEGVLYYIFEWDTLSVFADRQIYIALIEDGVTAGRDAITYDEEKGTMGINGEYKKSVFLIPLEIDAKFADPAAADRWIAKQEAQWDKEETPTQLNLNTSSRNNKGGITFTLQDGRTLTEEATEFFFHLYLKGDEIKSVQLRADNGKLLQPKEISKEAFERLSKEESETDLLASGGAYFQLDWKKAANTITIDHTLLTEEMWAEEALRFRPDSGIKEATFHIIVTKKDGSKVTQRIKGVIEKSEKETETAYLRFKL